VHGNYFFIHARGRIPSIYCFLLKAISSMMPHQLFMVSEFC